MKDMTSAEHQRPTCQDRRKGGPKPWPQGYCLHASSCSSEEGAWGATCVQASQQCPPPIGSRMFLLDSLSVLRESHSIARKSKQPEDFIHSVHPRSAYQIQPPKASKILSTSFCSCVHSSALKSTSACSSLGTQCLHTVFDLCPKR